MHRWPLCSKERSNRIICFLSSGSAVFSVPSISISLRAAFRLQRGQRLSAIHECLSHIVSLLRMILIATSLWVIWSIARTTAENMPLPRFACT